MTSWWRKLFVRTQKPIKNAKKNRARLGLESLEDRTVPATFHVSLLGNDADTGGTADPFRTIQHAIDAAATAADGQDIIKVQAGTYQAAVDQSISIPASGLLDTLLMQGGFDPTFTLIVPGTTIYNPQNAGSVVAADVDVFDDGVTIDGMTFIFDGVPGLGGTRESAGILARGQDLTLNNNIVEVGAGSAVSDAYGLQTLFGSTQGTLNITNNTFLANNTAAFRSGGVYLNPGTATQVNVTGNTVGGSNLTQGIVADGISNVSIDGNTLFRTAAPVVPLTFQQLIFAGPFNGGANQTNVSITNNLVNRAVDGGVFVADSTGIEVGNTSGNGFTITATVTGNTVEASTLGLFLSDEADGLTVTGTYSGNGVGIFAQDVNNLTLQNVTADANFSDGLRGIGLTGTLSISDSTFNDNDVDNNGEGDGIDLTNVGDVVLLRVQASRNDPGVVINGGASFSDTDGVFSDNNDHGIQLIDITGLVSLTRTTANDNDANNNGTGDGVNMTDGPVDADTNAVGALAVTGGSFSNTAAGGGQRFGIRVGDGIGVGAVHSVATTVAFQSDAAAGPLQHVSVTGNQLSGVEIEDGGTTASFSGNGNYSSNGNAGVTIASLSGNFTAADSTFSGNTNHGIQLIDIDGLVSLTRVTANDNDANNGTIGDGVNMTDGALDADTNAIGSLLVVGGSFSDTAVAGGQRYGIRVGNGISPGVPSVATTVVFQSDVAAGALQHVSITGNQEGGVEFEDGGTTASVSGNGNYSNNLGNGFTLASLSGAFAATAGSTFSNNTGHGLSLASVGDVNLTGISAIDNLGDGIHIVGAGSVTTDTVTATGNDPGVFVDTALSYTDIAGVYTGNDTHGIQLIDIAGLVSLTRTTANDNDANNLGGGDGVNMTDGAVDADTNAIGSLSVTGGSFSNTAAAGGQLVGIRVGDGFGIGLVHSVATTVDFQSDAVAGPLQHVSVTGNQSNGVEIEDGGTTASFSGNGNYSSNLNAGVTIASLSGNFTATDSTFSGNTNHGIQLIDIDGLVSLTRVTANDNDSNIGGLGDGVNMTDGADAGTDAIGSLQVTGGSFSDTAAAGVQRFGIRVGDGIGVGLVHSVASTVVFQSDAAAGPLQHVSITANLNSGVEIEDGGTTASFTNGTYSNNSGDGMTLNSFSAAVTWTGVTADGNTANGLNATALSGTISGSSFDSNARGILFNGGTLAIGTTTIDDNNGAGPGAGINVTAGNLTLNAGTTVTNNDSAGSGGGIAFSSTGTLSLTSAVVSGNTAAVNGGGIDISAGTGHSITTSTIADNTATAGVGGGINVTAGFTNTLTISESTIGGLAAADGNTAVNGGGIAQAGGTITVDPTIIENNTVTGDGGGVHLVAGTFNLTDSSIVRNNTAGDDGGGFFVDGAAATLNINTDAAVTGNRAVDDGGGVFVNNALLVAINDARIGTAGAGNVADNGDATDADDAGNGGDGGGLFVASGIVTITGGTTIEANSSDNGGGVNVAGGTVTVTLSTIGGIAAANGNSAAQNGGGLALTGAATVSLVRSAVANNLATGNGGGIQSAGTLDVENSTISTNTGTIGGGMHVSGSTANLRHATVARNVGTGVSRVGGTVNATQSLFAENTGTNYSGTIASGGHNLFEDPVAPTGSAVSDLVNVDALLANLALYGGTTLNHALLPGSAALDAVLVDGLPGVTIDQRGIARPQNTLKDIGAFESRGFTLTLVSPAIPSPAGDSKYRTLVDRYFLNADGTTRTDFRVQVQANSIDEPIHGGVIRYILETTPNGSTGIPDSATVTIDDSDNNKIAEVSTNVKANLIASEAVPGFYRMRVSAGGNNATPNDDTGSWKLFNQIVQTLAFSAQPTTTRSGDVILFGGAPSFQLTMLDQEGAPVVVSGESVSINAVGGPGPFTVGATTALSVGSTLTFQNLKIYKSSWSQQYRVQANYKNPNEAAATQKGLSNQFRILPFRFIIESGTQFIDVRQQAPIPIVVRTRRGAVRIVINARKAKILGIVNKVVLRAFDVTAEGASTQFPDPAHLGLATAYDGPMDLSLVSNRAWALSPPQLGSNIRDFLDAGLNRVIRTIAVNGSAVVLGLSPAGGQGRFTIEVGLKVGSPAVSIPNVPFNAANVFDVPANNVLTNRASFSRTALSRQRRK